MKLFITPLILALSLSACAQKPDAPAKRALFYKEGVSDKQMTRDLNKCASEAFKSSIENENSTVSDEAVSKKTCMHSKGYEIFYN